MTQSRRPVLREQESHADRRRPCRSRTCRSRTCRARRVLSRMSGSEAADRAERQILLPDLRSRPRPAAVPPVIPLEAASMSPTRADGAGADLERVIAGSPAHRARAQGQSATAGIPPAWSHRFAARAGSVSHFRRSPVTTTEDWFTLRTSRNALGAARARTSISSRSASTDRVTAEVRVDNRALRSSRRASRRQASRRGRLARPLGQIRSAATRLERRAVATRMRGRHFGLRGGRIRRRWSGVAGATCFDTPP